MRAYKFYPLVNITMFSHTRECYIEEKYFKCLHNNSLRFLPLALLKSCNVIRLWREAILCWVNISLSNKVGCYRRDEFLRYFGRSTLYCLMAGVSNWNFLKVLMRVLCHFIEGKGTLNLVLVKGNKICPHETSYASETQHFRYSFSCR